MTKTNYRPTIGIESHVQFKTKTKLFSAVDNDARDAAPNTLISHICFGLPGGLPVLNEAAVNLAIKAAFALNTRPSPYSKFDRKHYFYPDLPMGYQITQYDQPIIVGGYVEINIGGQTKKINIVRAHLEADAGKSVHPAGKDYSLVDLNRSGTPLLEIVSAPDLHSAAEAKAYAHELYLLMRYADVSDANLYYGNMRFDVNVSVSSTAQLGTRTETKNINSFRSVEKVVEYEIKRQIDQIEHGHKIEQQTRGWDEAKQKTFTQRTKENADDYRYMPDPDLPPIVLGDEKIEKVQRSMPDMPATWRKELASLGLNEATLETLIDAEVENEDVAYLSLIKRNLGDPDLARFLANWFVNLEIPLRRDDQVKTSLTLDARLIIYCETFKMYMAGKLSSTNVKQLIGLLLNEDNQPNSISGYAEQKNLVQKSDEGELTNIVKQVIEDNPKAVSDYVGGSDKAIGFLVGQVMKLSSGQANPALASELIKKTTEELVGASNVKINGKL